jgi:acyl-CoA reductase-like NAD-dependent aldehyde dehydrogenase
MNVAYESSEKDDYHMIIGGARVDVLPPGVFNIIIDKNDLGGLLTRHSDVAKVSFTGSTATGRKVAESGGASLKRLTLELGGNDAVIFLDGQNPDEIATQLYSSTMINAGQVCAAIKRVYVPDGMYDAGGRQYVAVASGNHGAVPLGAGGAPTVVLFALSETRSKHW